MRQLKHVSRLYRTINGERYESWLSFPSDDKVAAYRNAGVRCRRQGDELFVHERDLGRAVEIDQR